MPRVHSSYPHNRCMTSSVYPRDVLQNCDSTPFIPVITALNSDKYCNLTDVLMTRYELDSLLTIDFKGVRPLSM